MNIQPTVFVAGNGCPLLPRRAVEHGGNMASNPRSESSVQFPASFSILVSRISAKRKMENGKWQMENSAAGTERKHDYVTVEPELELELEHGSRSEPTE